VSRRRRREDDAEQTQSWYTNRETAAGIFTRPPAPVGDFDYERYRSPEPRRPAFEPAARPSPRPSFEPAPRPTPRLSFEPAPRPAPRPSFEPARRPSSGPAHRPPPDLPPPSEPLVITWLDE
jgi:hypothetical protein